MAQKCTVSIDVGTGSTRAAVLSREARILKSASREYEQIVSEHGWSEQRADDWWQAACDSLLECMEWTRGEDIALEALAVCGQMHGTVLVDGNGALTRETVPLWNDKRTLRHVIDFEAREHVAAWLPRTANPPTPAWPAFKLQWLRDNDREAYQRAETLLMPKDYINLRLTGERSMDWTEAACSFLMDPQTGGWSQSVIADLGLDPSILAPIRKPDALLGHVTQSAAEQTGLPDGLPVALGGADFAMALLGSGACRPGVASEVAGTSAIITLVADQPVLHPEISNIGTAEGNWGAFVLLEAGGDAARWARRVFHDAPPSYGEILDRAATAPVGSGALFFLPYLVGERLGQHRNSRAQFFGLSAAHRTEHLHRAVLEGVGFAVNRHLEVMEEATGAKAPILVASGGGAKADLWLKIKASIYNRPIKIPEEAECGLVGNAIIAQAVVGEAPSVEAAAGRLVRYARTVEPEPDWVAHYAKMQPIFDRLYDAAQSFYPDLEALGSEEVR
ncbi:MAG: FGGY family carbohydrate kinase [Pseudomonadota bacterium]